ncbi:unnamed protein product [Didymodactylos carnosus]|uniref:EF-hand domain-containing protein n=1 Tax=Didymodactylos carnosus TaxID=1234261 RepID=A0A814A4K9_9BILA|nr:unnamed protein product [Didymodactylos carnosus]CAF0909426.1 unnamed protein product [Didymodactylos carnosus]CAF3547372.1 unnamed protein product [Didymodactylos carnosus]CAF3690797.1 unnamed protein product [Didymodactylos carnosus]
MLPRTSILLLSVVYLCVFGHEQQQSGNHASQGNTQHVEHGGGKQMQNQAHDMEHIRHDLEGQVNKPKEEMTPEQQNFYYFKLHDTNNDNQLDGLEVVSAFNHVHDDGVPTNDSTDPNQTPPTPPPRLADEELMRLVDDILKEEDLDQNGFISYQEFKRAIEGQGSQK